MENIKNKCIEAVQKVFDTEARPIIEKEMRRLKIARIQHIMGVEFFTFNSGKVLSDNEFIESSEARKNFYDQNIAPWKERGFYQMVDTDIELF